MTYVATWNHICQLWPDWSPTDAQADLWRRSLAGHRQDRVRAAVDRHRQRSSYWTPSLDQVLAHLPPPDPASYTPPTMDEDDRAAARAEVRAELLERYAAAPIEQQAAARRACRLEGTTADAWGVGTLAAVAAALDLEQRKEATTRCPDAPTPAPSSSSCSA